MEVEGSGIFTHAAYASLNLVITHYHTVANCRPMSEKFIKLLLVEDNSGDVRLLREMLNEQVPGKFALTDVGRMSEAESHLASNAADIILLDLGLPDAQGLEAMRRAHEAAPRVPLVVLTGCNDELLADRALQEGAQDFLVKGQI
jgi:CheY-like chemotaxis protein